MIVATLMLGACSAAAGNTDPSGPTTGPADTAPQVSTTAPQPTTNLPSTVPGTTQPAATEAPSTTLDPVEVFMAAYAYAEPGPHPVGVTTLTLPMGPEVEVWYPAIQGTTGIDGYDVRDFVPDAIRAVLTADVPATFVYAAGRDAWVEPGAFPVVLFSHGFSGMRLNSSFLTSHLASHGMIVVAPDHPSRTLASVLSGSGSRDPSESVNELLGALELIVAEGAMPGGRFDGHVDADHVVALGHSAGGGTVMRAATDERIDAYVSMASGISVDAGEPLPDKPSFFLAGSTDEVVPAEERTRPAFEAAPSPTRLWIIEGVGHNGFDDFCTFGNGRGIIGVAEANGLRALLDAQPQLRTLGEDGCVPPSVPVEVSFPIIRHAVTAAIRYELGLDPAPLGLGPEVAGAYELTVEIAER